MREISNGILLAILTIKIFVAVESAISGSVKIDCVHGLDLVKITYVGEAQGVLAVNKQDKSCVFDENTATASYELVVGLNKRVAPECQMDKKGAMDIYTITVQGRLLHKDFEDVNDEEFLIQCNFQPVVTDVRHSATVVDIGHQPNILRQNKAVPTKSTFALSFVKIDGTDFTRSVTMGRKIRIKVAMTAAKKDSGFKPLSCKALSGDGKKTLVMMADGCGTGKPWDYDAGFDIKGMTALSPTFKLFRLIRRESVMFTCDFVTCTVPCDGNSCHKHSRKKRDIEIFHNQTTTLTAAITIPPTIGLYVRPTAKVICGREKLGKKEKPEEVTRKPELAATEERAVDNKHPCRESERGETCDQAAANSSQYRLSSEKGLNYLVKINDDNSDESTDKRQALPVEIHNLIAKEESQQKKAAIVVDSDHVQAKTALMLDLAGVNLNGREGIPEADEIKSDQSQIENVNLQSDLKDNDTHQLWKKTKAFEDMMHEGDNLLAKVQTSTNGNLQATVLTSANANLQTTKTNSPNSKLQTTIPTSDDDELKTTEPGPIPVKVVEDEGMSMKEIGFYLVWVLPILMTIGFAVYACIKTMLYFKQVKLDKMRSSLS